MSEIFRALVGSPTLVMTGWSVLLVLCESAIVAFSLQMWRIVRTKASVRSQYIASVLAMCVTVGAAGLTPVVLRFSASHVSSVGSSLPAITAPPRYQRADGGTVATLVGGNSTASVAIKLDTVPAVAGVLWIIGAAGMAVRLIGGMLLVLWVRRSSRTIDDAWMLDLADQLRRGAGIDRVVMLARSPHVEAPVVTGWRRPVIILPPALANGSTERALRALLAHEFAHVRRRDYIANLLQSIAESACISARRLCGFRGAFERRESSAATRPPWPKKATVNCTWKSSRGWRLLVR